MQVFDIFSEFSIEIETFWKVKSFEKLLMIKRSLQHVFFEEKFASLMEESFLRMTQTVQKLRRFKFFTILGSFRTFLVAASESETRLFYWHFFSILTN